MSWRYVLTVAIILFLPGCQGLMKTGTGPDRETPFGESVRAPFDEMIANAQPAEQILGSVYFDFDDASLSEEAKYELDLVATMVSHRPGLVIVEGHADHVNTERYNTVLGYKRALAVADYLKSAGVWDERLVIQSFGEGRPVASNWIEHGRTQNRRVVIKLLSPRQAMSAQEAKRAYSNMLRPAFTGEAAPIAPLVVQPVNPPTGTSP